VQVLVAPGVYRLSEPLVFTPEDGGTAEAPVTWSGEPTRPIVFRSFPGETALLTAADALSCWTTESDGVFSASMDWDLEDQNQMFADGNMLDEARWPPRLPQRCRGRSGMILRIRRRQSGNRPMWTA
jgi:hypothetical protein